MFDPKAIDDIANRLASAIPPGLNNLKEDLEKTFRAILQGALGKLDLVTREEFEVQQEVLTRTREKLRQMELRIGELEKMLAPKTGDETPTSAQD